MDFDDFIRSRKSCLVQAQTSNDQVEIVLGNESCDLDSAVCALSYAYLLQRERHTNKHIIPVLNVPRDDFKLKTEVIYIFTKYDIPSSSLVFIDDLDVLRSEGRLLVHLVDHNVLTDSQEDMASCVQTIVDHHNRDCPSNTKFFTRIEVVGSCCSIVTDLFYQRLQSVPSLKLAQILRACILGDTVGLSVYAGKVKPLDISSIDRLEAEHSLSTTDRKDINDQILSAKEDVSALSTSELLRKDTKSFTTSSRSVIMSSMNMSIQEFLARGDVLPTFEQVLHRQSADLIAVICNGSKGDVIQKHFMLYSKESRLKEKVIEIVDKDSDLQFINTNEFTREEPILVRTFSNIKISRKQVLPKLKEYLQVIAASEDLVTKLRADSDQLTFSLELSAPGTPAVLESPAPEQYSSHENSGSHTPNPMFSVEAPPNSYMEPSMLESRGAFLPSFNNSEMVKRIMIKKNKIGSDDMEELGHTDAISSGSNSGHNSCPFTPANSFVDRFPTNEYHLPSFNNREMMFKMLEKKLPLLGASGDSSPTVDESHQIRGVFTPHNSECETDYAASPAFDQTDLERRLSSFEASDLYTSERQRVQDTAHNLVDSALEQAISNVKIITDKPT